MAMRRHLLVSLATFAFLCLIWWWIKQAPYRVAWKFLVSLQKGDIKTIYELSDPYEKNLMNLKQENFQAAYDVFFSEFFKSWRVKKIEPHIYAKQFKSTLPPIYYPFVATFENEKGQQYKCIIAPRWTEDKWRILYGRWRVSFGNFVYHFHIQSKPIERRLIVYEKLLRSGFYAFPTETGSIFNVLLEIEILRLELIHPRGKR